MLHTVLRRHVLRCTDLCLEVVTPHQSGESKVTQLNSGHRLVVQEYVVQLDIPMGHVLGVAVVYGFDNLLNNNIL